MSETKHIAEMANKVTKTLFKYFKWDRKNVEDHSWKCVTPDIHDNKHDHPSDCVFYYRDPYDGELKYINTDLKSYKKNSITKAQIHGALRSLSYATNCATYNPNWKMLFKPEDGHSVYGMLFVYNHCGEYKGDFDEIIRESNVERINHLDSYNKIFILGPQRIDELSSIVNDIKVMIGEGQLPRVNEYCFFHPNQMINKNHFDNTYSEPATIEVLSSPWIIIKHARTDECEAGFVIYYMKNGSEVDEFIYLLDALSYYQILNDKGNVRIKIVKKNDYAVINLNAAIDRYFGDIGYNEDHINKVKKMLVAGTISKIHAQFSEFEIGLSND